MKKIPELDALRGLAAVGVVLFHAYPHTFFFGWSCVDLFFVLSGFLITDVILEHVRGARFFRAFYARRALRIWPVYYITLAAVVVLNATSRTGYGAGGLWWHLIFLQHVHEYFGVPEPTFIHAFSPSWSVAVEEQFYLIWPAALFLVGQRRVVWLALPLVAISVGLRAWGMPYDILITRFDGLAMGAILAQLNRQENAIRTRRISLLVGLIAAAPVLWLITTSWSDPRPHHATIAFLAFGMLYFAAVGLAVTCSGQPALAPLRFLLFRKLGEISFALYMFHIPVLTYVPAILGRLHIRSGFAQSAIAWVAVFALPYLSLCLLERPILALKNRFPYRERDPSAALSSAPRPDPLSI